MKVSYEAAQQIADLRRHYRRAGRLQASRNLTLALRQAARQVEAGDGLAAPRAYPVLARPGETWTKGRYWIALLDRPAAHYPGSLLRYRRHTWTKSVEPCFRQTSYRPAMRSPRRTITTNSPFERDIGYARAVVDGSWVFVSGTTGFDYATMTIAEDPAAQCEQALRNIADALAQAGATMGDVVRVRYILPDRADFELCWPALRACFGDSRPAATMIVAGLFDPRMKIEIEVTARSPEAHEVLDKPLH